jgi:tetratricopeptide (TPR) repeat protein
MLSATRTVAAAMLLLAGLLAMPARAENEGQADLDKATETRLGASSLSDLSEVIGLLESALEKGLDEDNAAFAKQMLASTRIQRGLNVTGAIFGGGPPDPRWPQFRRLALGDLERALELDSKQPRAWLAVAQLNLLPGGDQKRAAKALDQAIELSDEEPVMKAQALVLRAGLAQETDKKLADLAAALAADPDNVTALRSRIAILDDQKKWEEALADADRALKIDPDNAPTHLERAVLLIELGRLDDALASLDRAHELAPQSAVPLLRRGQVLGLQEKFDASLEALDAAYALEPDNLGVLLLRASVLGQLGRSDKALADVDQALKLKPGLAPAVQLRARLLAGSGEFKQAISELEALEKSEPEDVGVKLQLAMFYNAEDRPRKAIEIYSEILSGDPKNGMALHGRGDALLAVGKHAEAIIDYDKALEIEPDDPSLLNNFAWVLATSPDDAVRDGKRSLELATEACRLTDYKLAHILSTLGAAYAELGDFETAIKWSQKAVELGEEDQKEQLAQELESYRRKKPVRERQETPEKEPEPAEKEKPKAAPEKPTSEPAPPEPPKEPGPNHLAPEEPAEEHAPK